MTANTAAVEKHTANTLAQARQMVKDGEKNTALRVLHTTLTDNRIRIWVRNHENLIEMYFDLCVQNRKEQSIRDVLATYLRLTSQSQELRAFEEAVVYLLDKAEEAVQAVMESKNDDSETTWSLLSGEPADMAASRKKDDVVQFYTAILRHCTARTGHDGKWEKLFQEILNRSFLLCRKYSRSSEFGIYSEMWRRHFDDSMRRTEHQTSIMNHADTIDAIVQTKLLQLEIAADLKLWRIAASSLEETKNLFDKVTSQGKRITRKQLVPFYAKVANLFFLVNQPVLHSAAMIKQARFNYHLEQDAAAAEALIASKAVLSVLVVPETANALTANDAARKKTATLERYLYLTIPPTRESLANDVGLTRGGVPSILDQALPEVKALFNALFEVSTVDICEKVKPLLEKIAAHPDLSKYVPGLQDAAVQAMLLVMGRCFDRVSFDHLIHLSSFFKNDEFSSRMEPLLLKAGQGAAQITIDMHNRNVRFIPTTHTDVLGALGSLADQLSDAVQVCYQEKAKAQKKSAPEFVAPKDLVAQINAERARIAEKQQLAKLRLESEERRAALEKKREEERRAAEIERLRQAEFARNEKRRQEADEALAAQFAELKAIEQRKWVLTVLGQRHPDFKIDKKLATLSANAFKEAVTAELCKFIKDKADRKDQGLRNREHMERAVREEEIPKIKALAEASKEDPEERDARLAKREEQLRKDHAAAVAMRDRLSKMEEQRCQYEKKVLGRIEAAQSAKASKRDEQEELLRRDKLRREQEAAEAAAAAAEAAAAAAPKAASPTSNAAPAAFGGGKGAWKPRSRQ